MPPAAAWVYNCTFVSNIAGETGPSLPDQGGGAVWFGERGSNPMVPVLPIALPVAVANNVALRNAVRGFGAAYYIDRTNELQVDICNDTIANNFVIETADPNGSGGILYYAGGQAGTMDPPPTIRNTIIQSNQDVVNFRSVEGPGVPRLDMTYSNVARVGTLPGGLPAVWPGTGNINANPQFVALAMDDVRLQPGSPSVDTGLDTLLLPDHADLDENDNDVEPTPRAFVITDGRINDFLGNGPGTCGQGTTTCGLVDMGAHELF
ncbi:MAG: hypothetical protein AAF957_26755 [Planctomycetota bacterium]